MSKTTALHVHHTFLVHFFDVTLLCDILDKAKSKKLKRERLGIFISFSLPKRQRKRLLSYIQSIAEYRVTVNG